MSEFSLIRDMVHRLAAPHGSQGVHLASGDDAAVFSSGSWPIVSVDTMVEGVHWNPTFCSPEDVGYKLLASNLSDIAAMGGAPGPYLLALSLRRSEISIFLDGLLKGIELSRREHGLELDTLSAIGGDLTQTEHTQVLTLVQFGKPAIEGRILERSSAQVGDEIWLSGPLGGSASGLALLLAGRGSDPDLQTLIARHLRPRARIDLSFPLAAMKGVHAAIDISDGLVGDLRHILEKSTLGAKIFVDTIALPENLARVGSELACDHLDWALAGGEDYELLITADKCANQQLTELGLHRIGVIDSHPGSLQLFDQHNKPIEKVYSAFSHL